MIAEPDERYEEYCASSDFIREHIFPGGHLPSMGAMVQAAAGTSLQVRLFHQDKTAINHLVYTESAAFYAISGLEACPILHMRRPMLLRCKRHVLKQWH